MTLDRDPLYVEEPPEWIVATFPKEGMNRRERTARSKDPRWVAGFEDGYDAGRMWLVDDMRRWVLALLLGGFVVGFSVALVVTR